MCNEQQFLSATTYLCRMSVSSDTLHLAGSCVSGNPSSFCMFSPIHSASFKLVGRNCSTRARWNLQYAYPIHIFHCAKPPHSGRPSSYANATRAPYTLSGTPEQFIASVATAETLCCIRSSRFRPTVPDLPLTRRSACMGDRG